MQKRFGKGLQQSTIIMSTMHICICMKMDTIWKVKRHQMSLVTDSITNDFHPSLKRTEIKYMCPDQTNRTTRCWVNHEELRWQAATNYNLLSLHVTTNAIKWGLCSTVLMWKSQLNFLMTPPAMRHSVSYLWLIINLMFAIKNILVQFTFRQLCKTHTLETV